MATRRLTPVDAQAFWLAAKIPNDTFLLFGFDGVPTDVGTALDDVAARARSRPDLGLRVDDHDAWRYPAWTHRGVHRSQFVVHDLDEGTWPACLRAVSVLIADQLDATDLAWRLHVFAGVVGIPGVGGAGTVVVLQIAHVLGGGGRTSAHAALLFGRAGAVIAEIDGPARRPPPLPVAALRAARAHRRLQGDVAAGAVPAQAGLRPVLRTNALPSGPRSVRTVGWRRSQPSAATVTVAVLSAVSTALAGHLRALGDDPSALGAEVPMAKPPPRLAHNHFGNVGVGLHPGEPEALRRSRIADEMAARRLRAGHEAMRAADLAFAATPARLLRWGMARFDPTIRPAAVTGNTVVSSVNCGAADFAFGGAPVVMATAFAGLSPMMGLTHVVVGVGDQLTIGVHAAESALGGPGGIDGYVARLESALSGG